jgi:glutaminyl-peptide cyclotransferase
MLLPFPRFALPMMLAAQLACSGNDASPALPPQAAPSAAASPEAADRPKASTAFDAARAFNHVKAQVAFGPRPAGSAALERAREYIVKELKSYGLKASLQEFTPTTPQGKVRMKNIVAELPGASPSTVIIGSHYDTKFFKDQTFVGANDGASSTAAVLEIARVMAEEQKAGRQRPFTYQFVFFDGEEAFCSEWSECLGGKDNTYGSRHFVEQLKKQKRLDTVKAMILLDMVGDKDLTIPREETSSAWLVNTIWGTAKEIGYAKQFPARPFSIGDDDHMPFLRAGIPAVDIIDFEYGTGNHDNSYWHTPEDTLDKVSAESLKVVGDVVLLSLPKIEKQLKP